jgi:glycolate oxidase iron-sulfur subunit
MKGFATKELAENNALKNHLDHCLTCRACEGVCPAKVPYGQLIDQTRTLLSPKKSLKLRCIEHIFLLKGLRYFFSRLIFLYQKSGLQKALRFLGFLQILGLKREDDYLTKEVSLKTWQKKYPAPRNNANKKVGLFQGCINPFFDAATISASIQLLNTLGFDVYLTPKEVCCGAMPLHHGDQNKALRLIHKNYETFLSLKIDTLISLASGCGVTLQEHFAKKTPPISVIDISVFTHSHWPQGLCCKPLPLSVLLHTPCTLGNVLKKSQYVLWLLERIPRLKIKTFSHSFCCGAAGTYMLAHPQFADRLIKPLLQEIKDDNPDLIVTSNLNCALHLKYHMQKAYLTIPILHPAELLLQQLKP